MVFYLQIDRGQGGLYMPHDQKSKNKEPGVFRLLLDEIRWFYDLCGRSVLKRLCAEIHRKWNNLR